jgi:predicted GH43/DUF377 family glycosyl hydrolase
MISREWGALLLRPEDLEPSHHSLEVAGVFNPGAVVVDGEVVLMVRVAERPRERRAGFTPLPRWETGQGPVIDWLPDGALEPLDPRVVRRKSDGLVRLNFLSHLRVVRCGDGRSVAELTDRCLWPEGPFEEFGVEDARITAIGTRFWITYVAVSRHGASTALASTTDFRTFDRHGIIFCVENKDVVLFPDLIGGEYVALHRPNGATPFTRPEMWVARSPDLRYWGRHQPLSWGAEMWETGRVGAGPPPLRTPDGWLVIYHGNRRPDSPGAVGAYSAGAILLDPEDPARVLKRTAAPFFIPTTDFERNGFVRDVVFPTGIVAAGDSLLVYYGAADACTAVVAFSRGELLEALD